METPRSGGLEDTPVDLEAELVRFDARRRLFRGEPPPVTIGRYTVRRRLGVGGLGVVYAAYDPELDREVAIKVVRAELARERGLQQRLVHEAHAIAKVSHPNVIVVHDAGVIGDTVFVAMELVRGPSLGQWLRERPRSTAEVLEVFVQAGRGLAAAHGAGLVHRDFKPDNVMVGHDESAADATVPRVRVLDFGLALAGRASSVAGTGALDERGDWAGLTRTGRVVGTPAYMAPEQLRGEAADARSDQFAFCIALFEAFMGVRPFHGDSLSELARAVTSGNIDWRSGNKVRASSLPRLPRWLRSVLARGLSVDPRARWASMRGLVVELERGPARAPRWVAAWVGLAAVTTAWVIDRSRPADEPCLEGPSRLYGRWDDGIRVRTQAAIEAVGGAWGPDSARSVQALLDRYAQTWIDVYASTCRATHLGEQSGALLDAKMACLDARADELGELTALLQGADVAVAERAVSAVASLPSPDTCLDAQSLQAEMPQAPDAALAADIGAVRRDLGRARVHHLAGRYDHALALAEPALARAEAIGFAPLHAEALLHVGRSKQRIQAPDATQYLERAADVAGRARHEPVAAEAATRLVFTFTQESRLTDAEQWVRDADVGVSRAGSPPLLVAQYHGTLSALRRAQGRPVDARVEVERAIAAQGRVEGGELYLAELHSMLGNTLHAEGRYADALVQHDLALAVLEVRLGRAHSETVRAINNRANTALELGRIEDAVADYRFVAAAREASLGSDHPLVARALANLGNALRKLGNTDEALVLQRRALDIAERTRGRDHEDTAAIHDNVGAALGELGRLEDAVHEHTQALEIRERILGPEHPNLAMSLSGRGQALAALGDCARALPDLQRAHALRVAALGSEHPLVGAVLGDLGRCLSQLGRHDEALAHLQRALAIRRTQTPAAANEIAEAREELAAAQRRAAAADAR